MAESSKPSLFESIQVITGLAVIVGLVLVVMELRQSHRLAQVTTMQTNFSDMMSNQQSQLTENFPATFSKACSSPESLSDIEHFEMRVFRNMQLITIDRLRHTQGVGDFNFDWRMAASGPIDMWLATRVGRAQYQNWRDRLDLELVELIDEKVERGRFEDCQMYLEDVRALLSGARES